MHWFLMCFFLEITPTSAFTRMAYIIIIIILITEASPTPTAQLVVTYLLTAGLPTYLGTRTYVPLAVRQSYRTKASIHYIQDALLPADS